MIENYQQAIAIKKYLESENKDTASLKENDMYNAACEYEEAHHDEAIREAYNHYWEILEPVEREYLACGRCNASVGRNTNFCKKCGQRLR